MSERIGRQQRRSRLGFLDVLENHAGFADKAMFGFQHRYLAAGADRKKLFVLAGENRDGFEFQPLFEQRKLDHVVVVADGKPIELEHSTCLQGIGQITVDAQCVGEKFFLYKTSRAAFEPELYTVLKAL